MGLDHYKVRSWAGWCRHFSRARWAQALLAMLRTGAIAVETLKKSRPSPQEESGLAMFKANRRLSSR